MKGADFWSCGSVLFSPEAGEGMRAQRRKQDQISCGEFEKMGLDIIEPGSFGGR